jgi:tetratricopeptide (TPR) repeat protein
MDVVRIWEQDVTIPTYGTGAKNKNPMFLEKRVYQGSSGKVYPLPVIDKILDEKVDKIYRIVFLENRYIQVWIMPEIGGKIYRALDKTNHYDFVYYNRVIKPALVGLAGPWISGGIEFNWPQHHRPNTFGPVEYRIDNSSLDKVTLWVSETDRIYGTKTTTGFTLYEGKSYIEISGLFYNPTSEPQSFLWWANPAVAVHDETQSIFPPDVKVVMDHGKRDVSRFPISTSTYYKMDYSSGVDISRYKNIPVPTSYMAYKSDYDFMGGYDYRARAGVLHIADHHVAPGKKQWTWGCGDFGKAWDRNLTDEDGPYIELMTGVFTDNQPDFTWLQPYEEKRFTQYFMPYKEVGEVKNATVEAVVGLEIRDSCAKVTVYATGEHADACIVLKGVQGVYLEETALLAPTNVYIGEVMVAEPESDLTVEVRSADGRLLVSYTPKSDVLEPMPDPARAIDLPETLRTTEDLYLAGLHLEQYRHATYNPEDYYLEGLRRDSGDIRLNNAYGNLMLRRGNLTKAEAHFRVAIKTLTYHNTNPYAGEAFYNLAKTLQSQGRIDEAFDVFHKSAWDGAMRARAYTKLAQISSLKGDYMAALAFADVSLSDANGNYKARNVKSAVLRQLGRTEEAERAASETLTLNKMDFFALHEMHMLRPEDRMIWDIMRGDPHNYIDLAESYAEIGFYVNARAVLGKFVSHSASIYPMIYYYMADYMSSIGGMDLSGIYKKADDADPAYCFPNSVRDRLVLEKAARISGGGMALYYLGNLLYDKREYGDAIACWEQSRITVPQFPTTHRNLALAYVNKRSDFQAARGCLEKAFALDMSDSRVFYELTELYKKINMPMRERLEIMELHMDLVDDRDDLFIEYITALNFIGQHEKALDLLLGRNFHPWEGGEGKVPTQCVEARIGIAKRLIAAKQYTDAIMHLTEALVYKDNFGEGKLAGAQENNIYYYLGETYSYIDTQKAATYYTKASEGLSEPVSAMYYNDQPPHMIYYQGLALRALGRENEARSRFNRLVNYGEKNMFKKQRMDYFAVSLPDFLVFDVDLDAKNKVHCHYMAALGYLGLGETDKAERCRKEVLLLDPNHYGIQSHFVDAYSVPENQSARRSDVAKGTAQAAEVMVI